jgi:hypothetical protein
MLIGGNASERIRNAQVPERIVKLPYGYTATFQWREGMRIEWKPNVPRIHSARHRRKFFEAYKMARHEFMTDVAAIIGGNVLVVDGDFSAEVVLSPTKQ